MSRYQIKTVFSKMCRDLRKHFHMIHARNSPYITQKTKRCSLLTDAQGNHQLLESSLSAMISASDTIRKWFVPIEPSQRAAQHNGLPNSIRTKINGSKCANLNKTLQRQTISGSSYQICIQRTTRWWRSRLFLDVSAL